MANFNQPNQNKGMNGMKETRNHEGAIVHKLSPIEDLFSKVLGSFFGESTFYEKRNAHKDFVKLLDLIESLDENDKEYALKIAELGRLSNMIDYPLQILAATYNIEAYKGDKFLDETGKSKFSYYTDVIVRRAKDVNRILATHFAVYGKDRPLPKQMKKQLKAKLEQFDQYKLSKGLDLSKDKSLRDAIKLLHPTPKNKEMEDFYKAIIENRVVRGNGKVEVETALVKQGQREDKPEVSIAELRQSVYDTNLQALLRHIAKLASHGVFDDEEVLQVALNKIRNRDAVLASKLLPFRFHTAYKALSHLGNTAEVQQLKEAVEEALDHSIENVDTIDGLSAFLVDRSYSMVTTSVSGQSSVNADDVGMLLGAIAYKKGFGDLFVFSDNCHRVDVSRRSPVLEIVRAMEKIPGMHRGTDLKHALDTITAHAKDNDLAYDSLIILSDNDCYGYDEKTNSLTFGETFGWGYYSNQKNQVPSADKQINLMIKEGIIRKAWINNLGGNSFAIANTNSSTKNLITGFSEKFINVIDIYNQLGSGKDIRKVIDMLLEKERENVRVAKERALAKKKRR